MIARSSFGAGLALLTASFLVAGCDRGGSASPTASGGWSASASTTPSQDAVAARKGACAAFRAAVANTNTANQTFFHALEDPKRQGDQYDKPTTDAADAGAVIFPYAADQIEAAVTPQVPKDLAAKLGDFVQILHERARLYAQHAGTDKLDPNGEKYTPAANDLLKECPAGSSNATPPKLPSASTANPVDVKKKFCDVYSKQIQNTEDATTMFLAAASGDESHPKPQWGDQDKWLAGAADDTSIIFKYAANTLEAQALSPDLTDKVKALVASMRKLEDLYQNHKGTQLQGASQGEYGPAAEAVDAVCGIS